MPRKPAARTKVKAKATRPARARARSHSVAESLAESERQGRLAVRRDRDRARREAIRAAELAKAQAQAAAKAARKAKIAARSAVATPPPAPPKPASKRRRRPPPPTKRAPALARLIDGCERVLDVLRARRAPFEALGVDWPSYIPRATLRIRKIAPGRGWTPWTLVATYTTPATAYPTLHAALQAVADDSKATKLIGSNTLARMIVTYEGRESYRDRRRCEREWTIAEISPYTIMLERALESTDPGPETDPEQIDRDSPIAARYSNKAKDGEEITWVKSISLWLSSAAAEEVPF